MIEACLAVALHLASTYAVAVTDTSRDHLTATCKTMAVVKVRAVSEGKDGRLAGCTAFASLRYGLPHDALPAILLNEAGWLGAKVKNRDGSTDHGPYQINSQWLRSARQIFKLPSEADAEAAVTNDPCVNAEIAAIILARCRRDKGSLAAAIGCYASPTPSIANSYIDRIVRNAQSLQKKVNQQ